MYTTDGVDLLLKGGLFNRTGYVAAFDASGELDESGYARIGFALANWRRSGRLYVNNGLMNFPDPGEAWPAITRWAYYSALTGGTQYLLDSLETPGSAAELGAEVGFDDGLLFASVTMQVDGGVSTTITGAIDDDDTTVTVTAAGALATGNYLLLSGIEIVRVTGVNGNSIEIARGVLGTTGREHLASATAVQVDDSLTELGAAACFSQGLVSGTRYLALSAAKPGDTLGSNLIDDPISVAESEWTASTSGSVRRVRNNVIKSYGAQAADEPVPMWVALADGNVAASNVLWRRQFTTTPGDPEVGDNISHPVNSLAMGFAFG